MLFQLDLLNFFFEINNHYLIENIFNFISKNHFYKLCSNYCLILEISSSFKTSWSDFMIDSQSTLKSDLDL